jgi:hypothetical protein
MQSNQTSVRLKFPMLTILTFAVALGLVQRAHAFTFTTINNADGFPGFMAEGINGKDEIVGSSVGTRGGQCFLRDAKGAYTALNVPGASSCQGSGINDLGQIVGFFFSNGINPHGFLRDSKGGFTTIDVPGAIGGTQAFGINSSGEITGQFFDIGGVHGFLRDTKGAFSVINIATSTSVSGINDSGEFVGTIQGSSGIQGYLRDKNGTVTPFSDPGGFLTQANAINNSGEIVGFFRFAIIPGINVDQGFLRDTKGTFTTVSFPGAFHTQALGINASGKIVGWYNDSNGVHGFLATRATRRGRP